MNNKKVIVKGRPVKFPDSEFEKEEISFLFKDNKSLREIGRKTGMSKDMVKIKLIRYEIVNESL